MKVVYVLQDIDGGILCIATTSKRCRKVAVKHFNPAAQENLNIWTYNLFEEEDDLSDPSDTVQP